MNPPIVYDVTIPSSHKASKITKIVQSMTVLSFLMEGGRHEHPSVIDGLSRARAIGL